MDQQLVKWFCHWVCSSVSPSVIYIISKFHPNWLWFRKQYLECNESLLKFESEAYLLKIQSWSLISSVQFALKSEFKLKSYAIISTCRYGARSNTRATGLFHARATRRHQLGAILSRIWQICSDQITLEWFSKLIKVVIVKMKMNTFAFEWLNFASILGD